MPLMSVFMSVPKIVAGFVAVSAIASSSFLVMANGAIAQQASTVDPLEDLRTSDTDSDPFSGSSSQADIYNLMHRLMLNNGTTLDQFSRQQSENLGTAAEDFRSRQRNLLLQSESEASLETDSSSESETY